LNLIALLISHVVKLSLLTHLITFKDHLARGDTHITHSISNHTY